MAATQGTWPSSPAPHPVLVFYEGGPGLGGVRLQNLENESAIDSPPPHYFPFSILFGPDILDFRSRSARDSGGAIHSGVARQPRNYGLSHERLGSA
jgi:hypothetical protein